MLRLEKLNSCSNLISNRKLSLGDHFYDETKGQTFILVSTCLRNNYFSKVIKLGVKNVITEKHPHRIIKTENTCVPNNQTQKDLNFLPSLECKTSKHKASLPSLNSLKSTKQVYSALPNSFGLSKYSSNILSFCHAISH